MRKKEKKPLKYQRPKFLEKTVSQSVYEKWLSRKSIAHVKRDRRRGNPEATNKEYKEAIHKAVQKCGGRDTYTKEELHWKLISTYDNKKSQRGGRNYKRRFALLPSIDHVGDGTGPAKFKICAWRTNDAKSDLSYKEFVTLCKKVLEHS